ncbi:MAG: glycosyltransferase [Armatimonadota bacterium]
MSKESTKQVFVDETGKRSRLIRLILTGFILVVSVLASVFLISLGSIAVLQPKKLTNRIKTHLVSNERKGSGIELARLTNRLMREKKPISDTKAKKSESVVLGFYAPWEEAGLPSFEAHAASMTHLAPAWLRLSSDGGRVETPDFDLESNPKNLDIIRIAREKGVKITPLLSNANEGNFSAKSFKQLLVDPAKQSTIVSWLIRFCKDHHFDGINFDFEEIDPSDYPKVTAFLKQASLQFGKEQLELSLDVQTNLPSKIVAEWCNSLDYVVLMAYDQHEETGTAGPIASLSWVEEQLETMLAEVPEDKLVLSLGSYGYDWKRGKSGGESISFQGAMAAAEGYRDGENPSDVIQFESKSLNPYFEYEDEAGQMHDVWFLDAPTVYSHWKLGRERKLRGTALWAVGTEDPTIWKFLDRHTKDSFDPVGELGTVRFPFEVAYEGKGEVLEVRARPSEGKREITIDPKSGLIDDVVYQKYASSYLIRKSGFKPKQILLTFDDGPDPKYTPQILDVLRKYNAPAAFFFVGANVEANPQLAQRAYDEGHDVGNHSFSHPNLGFVSDERVALEINATFRVIESATGRSSILFRPPYNADSQPETSSEVRPVDIASQRGFLTIGENVDPNDWDPNFTDANGIQRRRTAEDIVRLTLEDLDRREGTGEEGNIVLLHDAGGPRDETVKALDQLIPTLRKKGYELVTTGQLLGRSRDELMPPIASKDRGAVAVNRVVFNSLHISQIVLSTSFVIALVLGFLKAIAVTVLALAERKAERVRNFELGYAPTVSVLIAAYNEEKTILDTVRSVLDSDYPIQEVIVVDDGSKDGTAKALVGEPRARVITKENGGKASALNVGLAATQSELVFCIDADTQLDPTAITRLVRHFAKPEVAAVAGNVQVGNVKNMVTAWQAVEYRTSQNLDRRALSRLNAITVIPGAIGMWRREAVLAVGGYSSDTLAEDMDLTWRLRIAGNRLLTEPTSVAYTEAPETWSALSKQRFRWSYGTFQCLWRYRHALAHHGAFGWIVLPFMWIFQIGFQLLGPIVDLQILFSLGMAMLMPHTKETLNSAHWDSLRLMLELYALFFAVELGSGIIAYRLDRAKPWPLMWLLVQRFAYRQLMYIVMLKAIWRALMGTRQGWGKLKRTGNVKV